jgi:predicted dehydrogenase
MVRSTPVRMGVLGGRRGAMFNHLSGPMAEKVTLAAICDLNEDVLAQWRAELPGLATYTSYERMLEDAELDAVFVATPAPMHGKHSLQALEAGKHVLSEVYAAQTLDECWALVEAVERTGLTYMMAENYCYTRPNLMVRHMVEEGAFGEPTYAEGAYIHDCRGLMFDPDGRTNWRGEAHATTRQANTYPTHSLGPVAQWLGLGRGDRMVSTATFCSRAEGSWRYVRDRMGADHPYASPQKMAHNDSATTVITTERGCVIVLRVDSSSPRPHNMTHYVLQGTTGAYLSPRCDGEDPLVWLEGVSPGSSPDGSAQWQPLWALADRYEHPRWKAEGAAAEATGHGGGDYFVLIDFITALLEGTRPAVDVYDAVSWSSIVPLSEASVQGGGVPMEVPRFRRQ